MRAVGLLVLLLIILLAVACAVAQAPAAKPVAMPFSKQPNGSNWSKRVNKPVATAALDKSSGMWYLRLSYKGCRQSKIVRKKTSAMYESKEQAESFRGEFEQSWNLGGKRPPSATTELPPGVCACSLSRSCVLLM